MTIHKLNIRPILSKYQVKQA